MSRTGTRFDALPLFASDEAIGGALLGPGKAGEWSKIAPLLERRGLPKIDALMGGRYTPAVKSFFDAEYRLNVSPSIAMPDGTEDLGSCNAKRGRRKTIRV